MGANLAACLRLRSQAAERLPQALLQQPDTVRLRQQHKWAIHTGSDSPMPTKSRLSGASSISRLTVPDLCSAGSACAAA